MPFACGKAIESKKIRAAEDPGFETFCTKNILLNEGLFAWMATADQPHKNFIFPEEVLLPRKRPLIDNSLKQKCLKTQAFLLLKELFADLTPPRIDSMGIATMDICPVLRSTCP